MSAPTPLVAVIVPVSNGERFLGATLESILTQTFTDLEVIVIDDASTDGTGAILASCGDRRLRVIRSEKRLGAAGARNRGLDATRAPYVAFCDSDDPSHRRRLESQVAFLQRHRDVELLATRAAVIDEQGTPTGAVYGHEGDDATIAPQMLFANVLATSSIMLTRAHLGHDRFDQALSPVEDYDLWCRLVNRGRACTLSEMLISYRAHADGITQKLRHNSEPSLQVIAGTQLARLEVTPSPAQLLLHRQLGAGELDGSGAVLGEVADWLETLWQANQTTRAYAEEPLRRVLAVQWLKACDAVSQGGCWQAWPLILRSPLTASLVVDASSRSVLQRLPWRTLRGYVRRRWPWVGPAVRASL